MEALLDKLFPNAAFTPTERNLLIHLLSHPNQTVSQTQLLSTVWGYQEGVKTRTLSTTIDRIRKKIDGHAITIHTVWGKGFCLDTTMLKAADLRDIVEWIIGGDPTSWITTYYNSQTTLLDHLDAPLPTTLSNWCPKETWHSALVEVLGQETLRAQGQIYLRQLCAQETLSLNNVHMLKRLSRHVPLDEQALTCLGDWSTSSMTPAKLFEIIHDATTNTPRAEALRLSLLALASTMTDQLAMAARLFQQLNTHRDTPDVMSIIKLRCAWSYYICGQYDDAIDAATQALELAQSEQMKLKCQVGLGQMYADCRDPQTTTLLSTVINTLATQPRTPSHVQSHHRAQLALATYYIHTNQPALAESTLQGISEVALHPNSHISYVITQAQLALLRDDLSGERWLRHHMGGISAGARQMFDFLHALFQSQRPHFQPELMRQHLHDPPYGAWSHIRSLTAICALDHQPSWQLTPSIDAQLTQRRAAYQNGECTLVDCYFGFAAHPLKSFTYHSDRKIMIDM